ncbi:MAG: AI-2 transport protein TqsA [Microgenomates group bacterium ADurb.Bin219]|nr:MAG: AI-2 transport protein TqsA [Microgenomates group bacterium ADurb.Bin219]HNP89477.1 AI-2E family transporter [Candidatus Woesebacteria bacterium]
MKPLKIEISHRTIIFTAVFIFALWLVSEIKDILFLLFIALMMMAALEPLVKKLESLKLPRWLAIVFIYIFLISFFGIAFAGIIPPLVDQTSVLINSLPALIKEIDLIGIDQTIVNGFVSQLGNAPAGVIGFFISLFSNLATVLVVAILNFYLLMERKNLNQYLAKLLEKEGERQVIEILEKIEIRLGSWIRAEITLMTFVGIISYFGFRLLGLEFALPLAIIAGILEIIPNFGPIAATIPAVLAGLAMSGWHALAALSWCFIVQQLENNFIVPRVMKKVVGLNPLVTILSLSVGLRLAGIAGATLAIPVVLALEVVFAEFARQKSLLK